MRLNLESPRLHTSWCVFMSDLRGLAVERRPTLLASHRMGKKKDKSENQLTTDIFFSLHPYPQIYEQASNATAVRCSSLHDFQTMIKGYSNHDPK